VDEILIQNSEFRIENWELPGFSADLADLGAHFGQEFEV